MHCFQYEDQHRRVCFLEIKFPLSMFWKFIFNYLGKSANDSYTNKYFDLEIDIVLFVQIVSKSLVENMFKLTFAHHYLSKAHEITSHFKSFLSLQCSLLRWTYLYALDDMNVLVKPIKV